MLDILGGMPFGPLDICLKEKNEMKEQYVLTCCSTFHWQKARNNARPPDPAELRWKAILSALDAPFSCYQLDSLQAEIACWSSICYFNQLEQFLLSFTWQNESTLGLLHTVNWGYCDNTLLCKTCLHAVYHQPISYRNKTLFRQTSVNAPISGFFHPGMFCFDSTWVSRFNYEKCSWICFLKI